MSDPIPIDSAKKRKKRKPLVLPPDDSEAPDLPVIKINTNLHRVVDQVVAALSHDAHIYQRDGMLVRLVRVSELDAAREKMTVGTPQIRALGSSTLLEWLTRNARYLRFDGRVGDWVRTLPTGDIVGAVAARGEWEEIRTVAGIIETPSMRPDGSVIDCEGYDKATGYIYAPQREYPTIPERPTLDDAKAALSCLLEPWREFPFRSDADKHVPLAALLTLICRPAIAGAVPAFVVDATVKGSGKTLLACGVTTLAHGRQAALMTWPSKDEELEKVLGAYALRGAAVICFDNVVSMFGGGALDKVLTCADRVELRVLGRSEIPSLAWRAVALATGNNMVIGADTTRRVLVCRLEPNVERPEEETHSFDLPAWCRENHPRVVTAALTLVRAYVVDGRKPQGLAGWGSFEAWRDLIGNAIVWAGGADVMATRPTIAGDDDSETAALRTIVELWPMLAPEGITAKAAIGALYPPLQRGEPRPADRFDALREALETIAPTKRPGDAPNALTVGKSLGKVRRRVVDRKCMDHVEKNVSPAKWCVKEVNP